MASLQRLADEAAPLRLPSVGQLSPEIAGDKLGELILEAFAALVGKR